MTVTRIDRWIAGLAVPPDGGEYLPSHNPANGRLAAEVPRGSEPDVLNAETPFGGYGSSGVGRVKGTEALATYTQLKTISLGTGS